MSLLGVEYQCCDETVIYFACYARAYSCGVPVLVCVRKPMPREDPPPASFQLSVFFLSVVLLTSRTFYFSCDVVFS